MSLRMIIYVSKIISRNEMSVCVQFNSPVIESPVCMTSLFLNERKVCKVSQQTPSCRFLLPGGTNTSLSNLLESAVEAASGLENQLGTEKVKFRKTENVENQIRIRYLGIQQIFTQLQQKIDLEIMIHNCLHCHETISPECLYD